MAKRTVRRSTKAKRARTARVKKTKTRKSSRKTKGRKKSKGRKGMNKYMIEKEKARKAGADSFVYNGTKYKKATTKTGMVIYKKGGQGGGGPSVSVLSQATKAYDDYKRGKGKGKGGQGGGGPSVSVIAQAKEAYDDYKKGKGKGK